MVPFGSQWPGIASSLNIRSLIVINTFLIAFVHSATQAGERTSDPNHGRACGGPRQPAEVGQWDVQQRDFYVAETKDMELSTSELEEINRRAGVEFHSNSCFPPSNNVETWLGWLITKDVISEGIRIYIGRTKALYVRATRGNIIIVSKGRRSNAADQWKVLTPWTHLHDGTLEHVVTKERESYTFEIEMLLPEYPKKRDPNFDSKKRAFDDRGNELRKRWERVYQTCGNSEVCQKKPREVRRVVPRKARWEKAREVGREKTREGRPERAREGRQEKIHELREKTREADRKKAREHRSEKVTGKRKRNLGKDRVYSADAVDNKPAPKRRKIVKDLTDIYIVRWPLAQGGYGDYPCVVIPDGETGKEDSKKMKVKIIRVRYFDITEKQCVYHIINDDWTKWFYYDDDNKLCYYTVRPKLVMPICPRHVCLRKKPTLVARLHPEKVNMVCQCDPWYYYDEDDNLLDHWPGCSDTPPEDKRLDKNGFYLHCTECDGNFDPDHVFDTNNSDWPNDA